MLSFNAGAACMVTLLTAAAGYAGTIVTTPAGLAPGTQYQLAFVTTDGFVADDPTIADYNAAVTSEAAMDPALAAFDTANGVTWTLIGSTTAVNASSNAASAGLVYNLAGVEVASSGLYSGSLLAPIDIDQSGNTESTTVWTGSNTAGTAAGGINDFGQTFTEYGNSSSITGSWIAEENGIEADNFIPLYALSSVITVASPSAAPEPGTMLLLSGAIAVLFSAKRLRHMARARPAA